MKSIRIEEYAEAHAIEVRDVEWEPRNVADLMKKRSSRTEDLDEIIDIMRALEKRNIALDTTRTYLLESELGRKSDETEDHVFAVPFEDRVEELDVWGLDYRDRGGAADVSVKTDTNPDKYKATTKQPPFKIGGGFYFRIHASIYCFA